MDQRDEKKKKEKCVGKEVGRFISCLLVVVSSIHPQDYRVNPGNVLLQDGRKDHEICTRQRIRGGIFKREDSQRVLAAERIIRWIFNRNYDSMEKC